MTRADRIRLPFLPSVLVFAGAAALCGGCDTGSSPSGRGKNAAELPPGADVSIEFERVNDARDPGALANFEAEIEGIDLRGATLTRPDGSVLPFEMAVPEEGEPGPLFLIEAEAPEELLRERFPNGPYTIEMTLASGEPLTLDIRVKGSFPDFPEVLEPADGAAFVPLDVRFVWSGPDAIYDVALVNEATGEELEVADAHEGFDVRPPRPLEPSTANRLEVGAETGPRGGLVEVEFESTTAIRFVTAP